MSACVFIASDFPLAEYEPPQDYPVYIDVDNGTIDDGGADDNYFLMAFPDVVDYTDKKYGVSLEWHCYTDGRAKQIIDYIRNALQNTEAVELWRAWLAVYDEYEQRPFIHRKTVSIDELSAEHIKEISSAAIWNSPDKMLPDRPSFYCFTITR